MSVKKSSRPPGRPRNDKARQAILSATSELLEEQNYGSLTIEGIAERAGAAKTTIYRWWPNKAAVIMEALLTSTTPQYPFPETDSAVGTLTEQMRLVAKVYRGKTGSIISVLLAEGQFDQETSQAFVEKYLKPRRDAAKEILQWGVDRGELRPDLDFDVALDALYGPIFYRLLVKHAPLEDEFVEKLAESVMVGLLLK